jgi:hypothetical protein
MGTLRLAFTPRYICYTLSILFTVALLLASLPLPPRSMCWPFRSSCLPG